MTPSVGTEFLSELVGTAILILLGGGVVATAILTRSKGLGGGWLLITVGWGLAVFAGVSVSYASGAHLNPAVTVGLLVAGTAWTMPVLLVGRTAQGLGSGAIGYATLLAVVALACGAGIQPFAARIGLATGGRQLAVGLAVALTGVLGAAGVAAVQQPWLGVPVAALLGAGYGICLVSGLTEVQRIAPPEELAALTAVYYSATYLGFLLPVVLAALSALAPEPLLLLLVAALCAASLAAVLRTTGRPASS